MESTEQNTWLSRHITLHEHDDDKAERSNAVSHAFAAIASLFYVAAVASISKTSLGISPTWALVVHGLSMVFLYACSALYHALPRSDAKRLFRLLDHANIYMLIAGTYTPVLVSARSPVSMTAVVSVWIIAGIGICLSIIFWDRFKILHVLCYIAMGWLIVFFWNGIVPYLPRGLFDWILGGGIVYTGGTLFYAAKRMKNYHLLWHVACMIASTLFCIGFLRYLA